MSETSDTESTDTITSVETDATTTTAEPTLSPDVQLVHEFFGDERPTTKEAMETIFRQRVQPWSERAAQLRANSTSIFPEFVRCHQRFNVSNNVYRSSNVFRCRFGLRQTYFTNAALYALNVSFADILPSALAWKPNEDAVVSYAAWVAGEREARAAHALCTLMGPDSEACLASRQVIDDRERIKPQLAEGMSYFYHPFARCANGTDENARQTCFWMFVAAIAPFKDLLKELTPQQNQDLVDRTVTAPIVPSSPDRVKELNATVDRLRGTIRGCFNRLSCFTRNYALLVNVTSELMSYQTVFELMDVLRFYYARAARCLYACTFDRWMVDIFSDYLYVLLSQRSQALEGAAMARCLGNMTCRTEFLANHTALSTRAGFMNTLTLPPIDLGLSYAGLAMACFSLTLILVTVVIGLFWKMLLRTWVWPFMLGLLIVAQSVRIFSWVDASRVLKGSASVGMSVLSFSSLWLQQLTVTVVLLTFNVLVTMLFLFRWIDFVHSELYPANFPRTLVLILFCVFAGALVVTVIVAMALMWSVFYSVLVQTQGDIYKVTAIVAATITYAAFGFLASVALFVYILIGRRAFVQSRLAQGETGRIQRNLMLQSAGLVFLIGGAFITQLWMLALNMPAFGIRFGAWFYFGFISLPELILSIGFVLFVITTWWAARKLETTQASSMAETEDHMPLLGKGGGDGDDSESSITEHDGIPSMYRE